MAKDKFFKKWWEVASSEEEKTLFKILARNPKYSWRSLSSILKETGWSREKLESVTEPFRKRKIIMKSNFRNCYPLSKLRKEISQY